MIHIDHKLCNPSDFTYTKNMFLIMDFMNGSTTILETLREKERENRLENSQCLPPERSNIIRFL